MERININCRKFCCFVELQKNLVTVWAIFLLNVQHISFFIWPIITNAYTKNFWAHLNRYVILFKFFATSVVLKRIEFDVDWRKKIKLKLKQEIGSSRLNHRQKVAGNWLLLPISVSFLIFKFFISIKILASTNNQFIFANKTLSRITGNSW